jgi:hypothetical protein
LQLRGSALLVLLGILKYVGQVAGCFRITALKKKNISPLGCVSMWSQKKPSTTFRALKKINEA